MPSGAGSLSIANLLARVCSRAAPLERALAVACRNPVLRRRLHVGAIAIGYSRTLSHPEIRLASLGGYKLYVNVAEHLGIDPYFFGNSCTLWMTEELIEPGSVFVDAGANVGHYTFFIASRAGANAKVISFEPNPVYAALIRRSIEANGFAGLVQVEPEALWERTGETLTFYLSNDPSNSGLSSLVLQGEYLSQDHTTTVRTVTLSDYARRRGIEHFRLVKIDVERAELQVLLGMADLLRDRRIDYLIVEMTSHGPARRLLEEQGYTCLLPDGSLRKLAHVRDLDREHFGDFLAVSPRVYPEFERKFSSALA